MSARVYERMPPIDVSSVVGGRAVLGSTWASLARLTNTVLGRGAMVVPAYRPGAGFSKSTRSFRYRIVPRYQCRQRVWVIYAHSDVTTSGNSLEVEAPASGATGDDYPIPNGVDDAAPIIYVEDVTQGSSGDEEITLQLQADEAYTLDSIACWEMPRLDLSTSNNDLGMDEERLQTEDPLLADDGGADEYVARLAEALDSTADIGRRESLLQWSGSLIGDSFSTTSTTFVPVFDVDPPMLARALLLDNSTSAPPTTETMGLRIYASTSDGSTTGELRMTMTNGDTVTVSISAGAAAWYPDPASNDPASIDVDTEDTTAADGRRSSTWDEATFEVKRTAGTGTVYVQSISVMEL